MEDRDLKRLGEGERQTWGKRKERGGRGETYWRFNTETQRMGKRFRFKERERERLKHI